MPGGPTGGPIGEISRTVWNDDFLATEIGQIGTHMDALGHAGCACGRSALFYNGKSIEEIWSPAFNPSGAAPAGAVESASSARAPRCGRRAAFIVSSPSQLPRDLPRSLFYCWKG